MTERRPDDIATLTVMRGEMDLLANLIPKLGFAAERHVVDTSDEHLDFDAFPDAIFHRYPLHLGQSFDAARSVALPHIRSEWVLIVDTDESIPSELVDLLRSKMSEFNSSGVQGVWIPRQNHVLRTAIRYSSAWPDFQLRFIRRDALSFSNRLHGAIVPVDRHIYLGADPAIAIQHQNFPSTKAFVDKINLYTSIEVDQIETDEIASVGSALLRAGREFLTRYVKMRGYRDGAHGLHFAVMMAFYRYLIAAKLWERDQ